MAADVRITADPDLVARADRIVLPGQGAFADCAAGLAAIEGLKEAMIRRVAEGAPFLGICVGMQLMAERGLEFGVTRQVLDGSPARSPPCRRATCACRIWAGTSWLFEPDSHPLLAGLQPGRPRLFRPFLRAAGARGASRYLATTDYDGPVVAMVATGNRAGTQFHVEKSQQVGLQILGNFLRWSP